MFNRFKINSKRHRHSRPKVYLGFSLIEIMFAVAIIGILAMIGTSSYEKYFERQKVSEAIQDIKLISVQITDYQMTYGAFPDSLAVVNMSKEDPWGNPYQYLPLMGSGNGNGNGNGNVGQSRKNRNMVPINSDFDLYSMGEDGRSVSPLTAKASQDDIVRGGNGKFVGLASDY